MAVQMQGVVTFEDVAVYLSRAEWDTLAEQQRELYRHVMLDNYELLTSLGYPGPKPDIFYRMERGEAPWVCMPQSPASWDRPGSPSPGCSRDGRQLEKPPPGWWPGAGEYHMLKERTQSPCPGRGWGCWAVPEAGRAAASYWRASRLSASPHAFSAVPPLPVLSRCPSQGKGRSELPAEAAGRGAGPAESREQAQTDFWPGREGAERDNQGVAANVTQSGGFPLHPALEQQMKKADPQESLCGERFQRSAQNGGCTLGEAAFLLENRELSVADLKETVLKDHCYCAMSEMQLLPCAPRLCPLREHDYCRNGEVGASVLQDHEYYHTQRIPYRGRVNKIDRLTGRARAMLHRLAKRRSRVGQIIRKAKQIMWSCQRCAKKRLLLLRSTSSAGCLSQPAASATVPPAKAEDNPAKGTSGAFCPPAKRQAASPRPRSVGGSQGGTSGACRGAVAAPPPSSVAAEAKREVMHPEASICREVQRAEPIWRPDAKQNVEGHEFINSNYESLRDVYKAVMRTVDHVLDSICQNFELSSFSRHGGVWPAVVQIDG
ncbi:uncharacterized protein RDI95_001560 [Morus bassanus]